MPVMTRTTARELKTLWLTRMYRKRAVRALEQSVVSISFDDVPESAYRKGAHVLEVEGVRGTFFVCLGATEERGERLIRAEEVLQLAARGHEIGCHTYTHCDLTRTPVAAYLADAARNRGALGELLGPAVPTTFSYPFGVVSVRAKRGLRTHYEAMRSSRPGINGPDLDLACLRSISLGRDATLERDVVPWLERLARAPGWAIFYTHGVLERPGEYDVRPELLQGVLEECRRRAIRVRPVGAVVRTLCAA
jgi:peptidoglycan/xylan/chitin deacetylase (PgdA/CDA1 family)